MIRSKIALAAVASLTALGFAAPAQAAVNVPLPTNAYITYAGLQWAWAIPLPASGFPNALSYQGTQGWRLPTATELANAPNATNFLFAGANVAFNGSDPVSGSFFSATNSAYNTARSAGACAAGYFNTGYSHCDWQDGNGQPYGPWAGTAGAPGFGDQLFVRAAPISGAVPEPATWAMMLAGFGAIGFAMRRRSKVKTAVRFA